MFRNNRVRAWMLVDGWTLSEDGWEGRGKGRLLELYQSLGHLRDRCVHS